MEFLKRAALGAAAIAISLTLVTTPENAFAAACKNIAGVPNKGCVDKRDLKKNAVTGTAIKKKAVTAKKLSKELSDILAGARQPTLTDSTGKEIGPNLGRSRVLLASNLDGTLFMVTVRRLYVEGRGNDIHFAGMSCTGQAYVEFDDRLDDRAVLEADVWGDKAYLLQQPDQVLTNVAILSQGSFDFDAGGNLCDSNPSTLLEARSVVAVKDFSGFTPPFSAEW